LRITTDELNDKAFTEMAKAFAQAMGVGAVSQVSSTKWRSPLGESDARRSLE
jgi:hypothetical protein